MRIGVFDSGVGGLSILRTIREALPDAMMSYCCDNLNFPYGTKSDEDVKRFALDVTSRFHAAAKLDVLVIACNTASTIALDAIRANLPIPVVGVVPAVKPAALASRSKIIGVLATPATIRRPYLDQLIREFASDCEVIKCGSSGLVTLAERKLRGDVAPDAEFRAEIADIIAGAARGMDQLVLGCTHFPLIQDELRRVLPPGVRFIDSGEAVANRVKVICGSQAYPGSVKLADDSAKAKAHIDGYCSGESFELDLTSVISGVDGKLVLRKLA